ncbi:bifunctional folylpolyglutamate synthase/dihydrofolate synthase [Frankia sp. CNm7]|uniref:tetrahydrofolate synthase n=2 Tax=Frankia nepalensis TaxID=1836974 RepID=A0A937RHX4_9ACTN|nr:bifunctional folylpolyglutamate synthase/dihydrofolate synthase [Frankia nepalensis]MBL7510355.1 bifunctional folylpolyglutamate synthase/dihydrofolate synthase [Frankia nepalensis]MBL7522689.1 bifunctional folylpolyglutamate synthase/dihydrofolate synthase [Frankia nepalensis]MBL7626693.1 bifunctional folylpolyglutamate synthase/dihydrofolate synthase [Frankia nepalensis]
MIPDLERMRDLVDLLGHPERSFPVVHLTGTNGKTSTARMIDSVLRAFGLRPGRYTSPHLESVTERISLDGQPASAEVFARAFDDVLPYVEIIDGRHPERVTFFELLTAMAFSAFADAPVDVAVVEVGMGGAWDATNVVDGVVQVVTPIALDHRELGDTAEEIAAEKAGILRPASLAVLGAQPLGVARVLADRAAELGTTLAREGLEFGVARRNVAVGGQMLTLRGLGGVYDEIFLPLHGEHQAHNAACALAAVEAFLGGGAELLDVEAVRAGFAAVSSPGRLEVVRRSPTIVLDGAHNVAGAQALAEALTDSFAFDVLVGVVGLLSDKDAHGMLSVLEPVLHSVVITQSSSPRAWPADELAAVAVEVFGADRVEVAPRLDDAIDAAVRLVEEDAELGGGGVIVAGSLTIVGEARRLLAR